MCALCWREASAALSRNPLMNVYRLSSCCTISSLPASQCPRRERLHRFLTPLYSPVMPHTNQHLWLFLFLTHSSFYLFLLAGEHHTSVVAVVVGSYRQQNAKNIHWGTTVTTKWSILITSLPLRIPMTTDNDEKRNLERAKQALLGIYYINIGSFDRLSIKGCILHIC